MIDMNFLDYVPVLGYRRFLDRTTDTSVPFSERVGDAVTTGLVSGMQTVLVTHIIGPTYGMVRAAQATVAVSPLAIVASCRL